LASWLAFGFPARAQVVEYDLRSVTDYYLRVARFFLVQHTKTGENIPNNHKIYQMARKYTRWPKNRPNCHEIYQHLPLQDPPKFTQIGIFGLKTNHLAFLTRKFRVQLFREFQNLNFASSRQPYI
jgi:hypothetical protein